MSLYIQVGMTRILAALMLWTTVACFAEPAAPPSPADPRSYLAPVVAELQKQWPKNRTVNLVFHGHSVPAGYFRTPTVDSLHAYPGLVRQGLAERFPFGVINVIVTAIGGENSAAGAARRFAIASERW